MRHTTALAILIMTFTVIAPSLLYAQPAGSAPANTATTQTAAIPHGPTLPTSTTPTVDTSAKVTIAATTPTPVVTPAKPSATDEKIATLEKLVFNLSDRIGELEKANDEMKITLYRKTHDTMITNAVASVRPAVVSITATKNIISFGRTQTVRTGAGTGFVLTTSGYIATNRHVVADTQATYTVTLNSGESRDAEVVYLDTDNDLAIIKITTPSIIPIVQLGSSASLKLGQTAIAVGNALGEFTNTVSVGIVSGLSRNIQAAGPNGTIETLKNVIQTDAAINQGNSGGPLVDIEGRVVGVNVATVLGSQNISFSIPIDDVKKIIETQIAIKR